MWQAVALKINKLKEFDKLCVAFGASTHSYTFGFKLTESDLTLFEQQYEIKLPTQLREFYLFFGNGGPGPDYGMYTLEQLVIYKQSNKEDDEYFYADYVCIYRILSTCRSWSLLDCNGCNPDNHPDLHQSLL